MNERIRELAEQAGFFVLSDDKIYIPTTSEEITDCQIKFAELIVRECARIAKKEQEYNDGHEIHVNIDYCILHEFGLQHFGVKR